MVFMVWKHVDDRPDDRWLYLPALDLVKRIAAADKRTSFVGSDFFYEDVSGRSITDDKHELEETTDTYYVLKNTPKDADSVEFSYYKVWIHRATFLPIKTVYHDKKGDKYREYQALEVKKIQEYQTVVKASMKDLRTGGQTVLEYSDVEYDLGLPDSIFTERYLRRVPAEYIK
jgi:outer membrane lipoprotein-sorting protein